jgi:hypothetical protein
MIPGIHSIFKSFVKFLFYQEYFTAGLAGQNILHIIQGIVLLIAS